MSSRPHGRVALLLVAFSSIACFIAALDGCGAGSGSTVTSDAGSTDSGATTVRAPPLDGSTDNDAGPDGAVADGANDSGGQDDGANDSGGQDDGANDSGGQDAGTGETCTGFAKGSPCGANGLPDYGYVCFFGSPPGIVGCQLARASAFGDTYCCAENKCVAQPDQDAVCTAPGLPHRYQCPPNGAGGSVAAPRAAAPWPRQTAASHSGSPTAVRDHTS